MASESGDLPSVPRDASDEAARALERATSSGAELDAPIAALLRPFLGLGASRLRGGASHIRESLLRAFLVRWKITLDVARSQQDGEGLRRDLDGLSDGRGVRSFLNEYQELARLLHGSARRWTRFASSFLRRLRRDYQELAGKWGLDSVAPEVSDLGADPHDGGCVPLLVRFGARAIVYRPRPSGMFGVFEAFVHAHNEHGARMPLIALNSLATEKYGWVPYCPHRPMHEEETAEQYYEAAGSLLFLLALMRGMDFHCENVVAHGVHPVPIDIETIFTSSLSPPTGILSETIAGVDPAPGSACAVGLTPRWVVDPRGVRRSIGGLLLGEEGEALSENAPRTSNGAAVPVDRFAEVLVRGFEGAYDVAQRFRSSYKSLVRSVDPRVPIRVLLRPTVTYQHWLSLSLAPALLRSVADRRSFLASLMSSLSPAGGPAMWESRQLRDLDIPCFYATVDSRVLGFGDSRLPDWIGESGKAGVLRGLEAMDRLWLQTQTDAIRNSLVSPPALRLA